MKIETSNLDRGQLYRLMVDIVAPRPIAWISTTGEDGVHNLAPYSAFTMLGAGMVGFASGPRRDGQDKDTLQNIVATKGFVVNVVDETLAEAMNVTASAFPPDVDEFTRAGVTPVMADLVRAPMVAESPAKLECQLSQILRFGKGTRQDSFVIGEVLQLHIRDGLYRDGRVPMSGLRAIGRLGGNVDTYWRTQDTFEMERPEYEAFKDAP